MHIFANFCGLLTADNILSAPMGYASATTPWRQSMLFANFKAIAWGLFLGLAMLGFAGFLSGPIYAQVAGATLNGTVADASGAGVPNANVSIKNTATGVARDITTDSDGFYSAPNLLPGTYDITVSASGFSTAVQTGLTLTVGAVQALKD